MNQEIVDPIWNVSSILLAETLGDAKIRSSRTDGDYRISMEARGDAAHLNDEQRAILTTWLVDQRGLGIDAPLITTEVIQHIINKRNLRFSEKRDRFFRFVRALNWQLGATKTVSKHPENGENFRLLQRISAWVESKDILESVGLLNLIADDGLITFKNYQIQLTSKGFERLEQLETGGGNSTQAFVAMWFDDSMKEAWRAGFAPSIRDAGYEPFRIDGLHHNGKIDDEIVAQIKQSRFLIADFTCGGSMSGDEFQPNPRGGVYYEAGLAHGLGMDVIFTCREDRMDYLHFDTRQFAHIVWQTSADLRTNLYNRIAATLKVVPGAPGPGLGAIDP